MALKSIEGDLIKFKATSMNVGALEFHDGGRVIPLLRNGVPLKMGDLYVGEEIVFDRFTGEIK